MIMRLPDVGSQYLFGFLDADRRAVRRRQDLQGDAAAGHPGERSSGRSRSTTTRPARCCRRRSGIRAPAARAIPRPAAEADADGSTTVYFGPKQPDGVKRRQLDPDPARQGLVRDPAPLQPARAVLRQGLATERDRKSWELSAASATLAGRCCCWHRCFHCLH